MVALVTVTGLAALALLAIDLDGGDRAATDAPAGAVVPLHAGAVRSYITIGTNDGRQFSDAQYREIARSYQVVLFTKFHADWDVERHHEAARRLKELNPDLQIYAYMSTKYWFNGNRWGDAVIDPAWFLRDSTGAVVPVTRESQQIDSKELGAYVDVSDPAYRGWLLGVAESWLQAAPYDGIRFDAADHIGDEGPRDIRRWQQLLAPERVQAYNDGIDTLLAEAGEVLRPATVLFNGISPSPIRGAGRNLDMLELTDGAMDENFCVSDGEPHDIVEDVEIMERHRDKRLHLRVRIDPAAFDGSTLARLRRLCAGSFLMGWQPGFTYLNVGPNYGPDQLGQQPVELELGLGEPTGNHGHVDSVLSRRFDHGVVYVNLGAEPATVELPRPMVRMEGGEPVETAEGSVTVGADDAAFFLDGDTEG